MDEPFWRWPMERLTYETIAAFVAEGVPEGAHLEYKAAVLKQNGLPDFDRTEFLETIVAFANTRGGLLLYGVDEDADKQPVLTQGIAATTPKAQQLRDPADPLLNVCAVRINPRVSLETRTITIADGPHVDNRLLLIRVHQGALPPYSLNDRHIYIRSGERDELATVAEIEDLFRRRADLGVAPVRPWSRVLNDVFAGESLASPERAPALMVGLTPAFPAASLVVDEGSDAAFQHICSVLFGAGHYVLRLPDGIIYAPGRDDAHREDETFGCAYADGSIAFRVPLGAGRAPRLDLVGVWRRLRAVLVAAEAWPRATSRYGGPLVCRIALGDITDMVASAKGATPPQLAIPPAFRNRLPGWHCQMEWASGGDVDDLIELVLASLARQLQFPDYHAAKRQLRTMAEA